MLVIILIIVLAVLFFRHRGKKKAAEQAAAAAAAAAKKKAEREARLVNGEPVERTGVPEPTDTDDEVRGPNGKLYHIPHYSHEQSHQYKGDWDPVYCLLVSERYADYLYEGFVERPMIHVIDRKIMVNLFLSAAEAYAYGQPDNKDLYQSERFLLRRMEDRTRALEEDGYYRLAYPPVDMKKAVHYYELLKNIMQDHRNKLTPDMDDDTLYRTMRALAELGHLYGYLGNEKDSRHYYDMGFRGVANDELLQLDVIHAMMAGYPRNPETYDHMIPAMLVDWIKKGSALAKLVAAVEYKSYDTLDKKRLAASPEEAAKVYKEGADRGDAYCLYMLGRCATYGYGMEMDTDFGWKCLTEAGKQGCASAVHLMIRLSDNPESVKGFREALKVMESQVKDVSL